jgi:hypothetical protein
MTRDDTPQGWDEILEPGEHLLWQGQPDATLDTSGLRAGGMVAGVGMTAFALFWTYLASGAVAQQGLIGWIFPMFGLFFVILGLRQAGGSVFIDAWRRRRTWYSLTNRRAFIATDFLGKRSLEAYPITGQTLFDHDGASPGSIWFATDFVRTKRGSRKRRVGFERLADSGPVLDLMVKVQREQA